MYSKTAYPAQSKPKCSFKGTEWEKHSIVAYGEFDKKDSRIAQVIYDVIREQCHN